MIFSRTGLDRGHFHTTVSNFGQKNFGQNESIPQKARENYFLCGCVFQRRITLHKKIVFYFDKNMW